MEAHEGGETVGACNAGPNQRTGERYPYRQLEHENTIRLLFITPGFEEENSSTYTLLHAELGNISYQALSYEWGLPSDDDPYITIDGHTVRIRKNLSEALKQISSVIRYLDCLPLWIDALCINQNDDPEKSQQVQKMGKIFSSAKKVLAWTGPMANDSDYAMDVLNSASRYPCSKIENNSRAQTAILAWCNRPYWKRIWIIQELFLANRLVFMCGSRSIPRRWTVIDNCLLVMRKTRKKSLSAFEPSNFKFWDTVLWRGRDDSHTLRKWLYVCATSQIMASDTRDYIYAVLSILHETRSSLARIIPDYTKSAETVFKDLNTLMMDKKAREGCESCIGKAKTYNYTDYDNKIVNGWLNKTLGLNVQIGWHDASQYPSCNSCGRPERRYSEGELSAVKVRSEGKEFWNYMDHSLNFTAMVVENLEQGGG